MRTRYPWNSLTEVNQTFEIDSEEGKKYVSQLVYAANKSKSNVDAGIKFRFYRDGEKCIIQRIS